MITEKHLESAVAAGIINQPTATALIKHANSINITNNNIDDEQFRLVTGFNDIFVVIASILLLISLYWIGGPLIGSLLAAAAAWGLAEFFVLKRRMALPAIVLLLAFVASVLTAGIVLINLTGNVSVYRLAPEMYILPALLATFSAWLHWRRFHVPITIAAGTSALVLALIATADSISKNAALLTIFVIVLGIAVFIFAMYWDAADTKRQTRSSDVGFWLHIIAAPLIIHPVFELLGVLHGNITLLQASLVFILYIAIAAISLLIDRRALMVSALGYVVYVFSTILSSAGTSIGFAITALIIGSALLMLSAFWHQCRAALLNFLPNNLKQYLPQ